MIFWKQKIHTHMKWSIFYRIDSAFLLMLLLFGCSIGDRSSLDINNELTTQFDESKPRNKILFDFEWRFHRGDIENGASSSLGDSSWRLINLPHDWSIEDIPGTESPIDPDAIGEVSSGFFVGGTGWYRKKFNIPPALKDKRIYLQFDGIYMNGDIWLNEKHLGNHPYGYTTFGYDITDLLQYNEENVLAVEVKNEGRNSRWYSGSGIYRHVWLCVTEKIYIPTWGVYITTPEISDDLAKVNIDVKVKNDTDEPQNLVILSEIYDPQGLVVSKSGQSATIPVRSAITHAQECTIENPKRWDVTSPEIYKVVTRIQNNDKLIDVVENTFGIRTISFDIEEGFLLNGKETLLKGGCMHHGNGPLGSKAFDRAEERRVELMKASGYNSIRCAHNPPSEAFLEACDRLGILVIDEAFDMWKKQKNPQDYHLYFDEWWKKDVKSMVLRDRNHPSIIMWSTGNEIREMEEPEGIETSELIGNFIRELDPTRPVTSAVNGLNPGKDPYFSTLDLSGYNYAAGGDHGKKDIYAMDRKRVPGRIMYGAESYPLEAFGSWMAVVDYPYVIGDFVWTGFDYLGEASIGWMGYMQKKEFYPWSHAYCGDIDICGWKRPQSYYRDILWENGNQPYIFVVPPEPSFEHNPEKMDWSKWEWHDVVRSWNWEGYESKDLEVHVYNSSERVELFLNDESLGVKETNRDNEWIAKWIVPYKPGILKTINYTDGRQVSSDELHTSKTPSQIKLYVDRSNITADGQDLCYVTVELQDVEGYRNPTSEKRIDFSIQGPGSIVAVGSSNPMSQESYQKPFRKTYQGRCLVIIRSDREPGTIQLEATSNGLRSDMIIINAN